MIDEDWLARLSFDGFQGVRVNGLLGMGEHSVVLRGILPAGEEVALKTRRHLLGYHIREVPPQLMAEPNYRMDTLNRKLRQLVGMPGVDEMISGWDRLFAMLTKTILEHGAENLLLLPLASVHAFMLSDSLPLLVHSGPIRRRLQELSEIDVDGELILTVNGGNFPITDFGPSLVRKAADALGSLTGGGEPAPIERNPLFVWGGAAMEGFFDKDRERAAVEFIRNEYGSLAGSPDAGRLVDEADALANVFAFFFSSDDDRKAVARFTAFCAKCGFAFEVHDRDGKLVVNGLSLVLDE